MTFQVIRTKCVSLSLTGNENILLFIPLSVSLAGRRLNTRNLWFCSSVTIPSVYPSKIPTHLPGTLTHSSALTELASASTGPKSSFNSCLSLCHFPPTVAHSFLVIHCSGTLLFLVFFRSRRKSCVQSFCGV